MFMSGVARRVAEMGSGCVEPSGSADEAFRVLLRLLSGTRPSASRRSSTRRRRTLASSQAASASGERFEETAETPRQAASLKRIGNQLSHVNSLAPEKNSA